MEDPNQWGFLLMVAVVHLYIFGMLYWIWTRPNSALSKHFDKRAARRRKWRGSATLDAIPQGSPIGNTDIQRQTGQRPTRRDR